MKEESLVFSGKTFISSRRASQLSGYTIDYIGQLARAKKIDSQMVGRTRFIGESSLLEYMYASAARAEAEQLSRVTLAHKEPQEIRLEERSEHSKFVAPSSREHDRLQAISPTRDRVMTASSGISRKSRAKLISVVSSVMVVGLLLSFFSTPFVRAQLSRVLGDGQMAISGLALSGSNVGAESNGALETLQEIDAKVIGVFESIDAFFVRVAVGGREKVLSWFDDEAAEVAVQTNNTIATTTTQLTESDIERIVAEYLQAELQVTPTPQGGVVSVPSTGDVNSDALLKEKIRQSFSDQVRVTFDESKTSGVVVPRFRTPTNDEYIFVLVPVNP